MLLVEKDGKWWTGHTSDPQKAIAWSEDQREGQLFGRSREAKIAARISGGELVRVIYGRQEAFTANGRRHVPFVAREVIVAEQLIARAIDHATVPTRGTATVDDPSGWGLEDDAPPSGVVASSPAALVSVPAEGESIGTTDGTRHDPKRAERPLSAADLAELDRAPHVAPPRMNVSSRAALNLFRQTVPRMTAAELTEIIGLATAARRELEGPADGVPLERKDGRGFVSARMQAFRQAGSAAALDPPPAGPSLDTEPPPASVQPLADPFDLSDSAT
jgi:hypothetical protein